MNSERIMAHPSKNTLLAYHFKDEPLQNPEKIEAHVKTCSFCQAYLNTLNSVETYLDQSQPEVPAAQTFDLILDRVAELRPVKSKPKAEISPAFFSLISALMVVLLGLLYFIQEKIQLTRFWEIARQCWLVEWLGSFGFVVLVFFGISSLVLLSLMPVLLIHKK